MTLFPPDKNLRASHPSQPYREGWDRSRLIHYLILLLAAFIAVLPRILYGCSCGHDFNFHLLNWMEAARQFTHGNLHPHWAFSPAYNAGEPRFVFYPPLSWAIGAVLGLLMPWTWTPIAFTWLALSAAGFTLYRLARKFATPNAALLAASLYLVNPYTLYTAYERTAYAELLAAAWIPLLLLAILRKKVTIPGIAIPIALLWLTNDPAAVMGCYALALLTLIRLIQTEVRSRKIPSDKSPGAVSSQRVGDAAPLQIAATATAGTLLGLGLAAFYILPAAYERRYVQIAMALAPGSRIQDNFLFHHTSNPTQNAVLNTAGVISVVLLSLTAIIITVAIARSLSPTLKNREKGETQPSTSLLYPLAILTLAIAFLQFPLSNPIWQHLPELAFLQFPWRLLAILASVLGLTIAFALTPVRLKTIPAAALSLALAAFLGFTGFHLFRQYCYPEDTVPASLALFNSNAGADPNNEYTPNGASNNSLGQINPPYWLIPPRPSDANKQAPDGSTPGPAPTSLTLNSPTPQVLVLNLRDYPAWYITLNQTTVTTRLHRDDGLIAFPIPAGLNHIAIAYTHTLDQTIGNLLTLLSIALLLLTLRHKRPRNP